MGQLGNDLVFGDDLASGRSMQAHRTITDQLVSDLNERTCLHQLDVFCQQHVNERNFTLRMVQRGHVAHSKGGLGTGSRTNLADPVTRLSEGQAARPIADKDASTGALSHH